MEVTLDYEKTDIGRELKKNRENKLKTFYLNFCKNKKMIQTSVYAGLLFDN